MKKNILVILGIATIVFGCKKSADETDTSPTIELTTPTNNFLIETGSTLSVEGIAIDQEGLTSLTYKIESVEGSYYAENLITLTGESQPFSFEIEIPNNASVGAGSLTVLCTDTDGNEATVILDFCIEDNIAPELNNLVGTDLVVGDSVLVYTFQNENEIVDSLTIVNYADGEIIGTVKDNSGIRKFMFGMTFGVDKPPLTYLSTIDLTEDIQPVYGYKITVDSGNNFLYSGFGKYYCGDPVEEWMELKAMYFRF